MLPKALKSCPESNKSPNLVTLIKSGIKADKEKEKLYSRTMTKGKRNRQRQRERLNERKTSPRERKKGKRSCT